MSRLMVVVTFLLVMVKGIAADMPDAAVGKTYWFNDRTEEVAPVNFYTGPHGKLVTFAASHSFTVLESDTNNPHDSVYKVKIDDGQELYHHQDDFQRDLFNDHDYLSYGRGYSSLRQYIFTRPPGEITGAIDRKQAAARRTAAVAKKAEADALVSAQADAQCRIIARIARGGVRLGMTREGVRQSSRGMNQTTLI
jgi:hypothetical protein